MTLTIIIPLKMLNAYFVLKVNLVLQCNSKEVVQHVLSCMGLRVLIISMKLFLTLIAQAMCLQSVQSTALKILIFLNVKMKQIQTQLTPINLGKVEEKRKKHLAMVGK